MVIATPIYKECRLGRGAVVDGYRGCVVDPFEDILDGLFGDNRTYCSCDLTCKLKHSADNETTVE